MKIFLLIIFLNCFADLQAQNNSISIEFSFDSLYFNKESTKCDKIEFEDKILKANIIDTTNERVIAEFLRITDNTYYFRKFYKNGKSETEGKCILSTKPIKSYEIPNFDNNGKLIKQITISVFTFDKVGKWFEKVNDTIERHGIYNRNIKIGKWTYLKKISEFDAIEIKDEEYVFGKLKNIINSNTLESKDLKIEKILLGMWKLDTDPTKILPESLVNYSRVDAKDLNNYKNNITFKRENNCTFSFGGGVERQTKKYNCKWTSLNNIITIKVPELKFELRINYVSSKILRGAFFDLPN
jgi:hypothetical protein